MKVCSKCGVEQDESEFYRDARKRDGLYPHCKKCHLVMTSAWKRSHPEETNAMAREARMREPERHLEAQRAYRERHPEAAVEYRQRNRARRREYLALWVAKNKEYALAYQRDYYARNIEAGRAKNARRDALRRGAPLVENVDRAAIYARDGGVCHICGGAVPVDAFTLDHLVPLSKGGEHSARNLRVAHRSCNSRRKDGLLPAQLLLVG